MSKDEELIIEFEEAVNEDGSDLHADTEKEDIPEKTEENLKPEEKIKTEEELLKAFEEEYNEGRDERAQSDELANREEQSSEEIQFFDEDDEEADIDEEVDNEDLEIIETDGEEGSGTESAKASAEPQINDEEADDAARALEEYERRMEAEAAAKRQEEAQIYRQLMHEEEKPKETLENIPEEKILSGETVIAEAVSKKIISENEISKQEESESLQNSQEIEVSEKVALDEKKPVYITEKGRLPLSVCIETNDKIVSRIAQIGDVLPVKCTKEFYAESFGAVSVALNLYAGERPFTSQNRLITKTRFKGARMIDPGKAVITVELEIDTDCNIKLTVIDEGSLKKRTAVIDNSWVPSDDEIYRIVQEAKENFEDDNKLRERIRLIRQAREGLIQAKEALKSRKKKLSKEQKNVIKKKCRRLSQRLKRADMREMSALTEKGIIDALSSLNSELR